MEKEQKIKLLQKAISAAIKAGEAILEVYNSSGFDVEFKEDESPVTIADKRASKIIISELAETGIPSISEEEIIPSFEERKDWPYLWIIDPLDGTKEFVKKRTDFTVNIALIEKDSPIIGVIYLPVEDILYFGGRSLGAFKLENAKTFSARQIMKQAKKLPMEIRPEKYTMVGSRSHMNIETQDFFEKVKRERGEENVKIEIRGSSLKMCVVAEGIADLYPRLGNIMEWDIAAGHAICEAAGCSVTSWDGSRLVYNKKDLHQPWFKVERHSKE